MAKLSKKQLLLRRKVIISEIKRIAVKLNKPVITQFDFVENTSVPFPKHAFVKVFGGFLPALEAAGLKKDEYNFYIKRNELKHLYKQIALKYDNRLSLDCIVREVGGSASTAYHNVTAYFGGILSLCKTIKCGYKSESKIAQRMFDEYDPKKDSPTTKKQNFSEVIKEVAKEHENSLSINILMKNQRLSYATITSYSNLYFGGLKKMCEELGIIWVEGNHGIDEKELAILKDIRDVYKTSGNKITRDTYSRQGHYSLEAIEDYFGSFGKACLEVNIRTEAMKA